MKVIVIRGEEREFFPARHRFSQKVGVMLADYRTSVCQRYAEGQTLSEIAKADGTNPARIRALLARRGVEIRPKPKGGRPAPAWEDEARASYQAGETLRAIGKRHGCTWQNIHRLARARGWVRSSR